MRGPGRMGTMALLAAFVLTLVLFNLIQTRSDKTALNPVMPLPSRQQHKQPSVRSASDVNRDTMRALWTTFGDIYGNITGNQPVERVPSADAPVSPESRKRARNNYKAFLRAIPKYRDVQAAFSGRAIVIAGGGYQMDFVYFTVKTIRKLGCTLPIQLWVCSGRGEMPSPKEIDVLRGLMVSVHDVDAVAAVFPEMVRQLHSTRPGDKPYIIKQIALVSSSCKECLLLDADNTPLRNPTFLFEDEHYLEHHHVLWPDFWHFRAGPASIREIFGLKQGYDNLPDTRTVESGQMVLDKEFAWETLMLSVWMQLQTEYFDNQMRTLHHLGGGGDKQTFLIGCLATNSSCWMIPKPVASAGVVKKEISFCGRSMVQHGPDGKILFMHSNMDKKRFREDIRNAPSWSEDLRRESIIRVPKKEGSWSVSFQHDDNCEGGKWVVKINSDYEEFELNSAVTYDYERERFYIFKEWAKMVPPVTEAPKIILEKGA